MLLSCYYKTTFMLKGEEPKRHSYLNPTFPSWQQCYMSESESDDYITFLLTALLNHYYVNMENKRIYSLTLFFRNVRFRPKIRRIGPQMWQFWDFFRSEFSTFCRTESIWGKSDPFFSPNLTFPLVCPFSVESGLT